MHQTATDARLDGVGEGVVGLFTTPVHHGAGGAGADQPRLYAAGSGAHDPAVSGRAPLGVATTRLQRSNSRSSTEPSASGGGAASTELPSGSIDGGAAAPAARAN